MGYRGCQPTSPASRWLRCQDNAASDSHADAMECCSPQQEYRHSTSEHVKEGLILQDEDGVSGLNAAVSINQSIDTASPRALRTLLRMMVHSQPKCRDLADAFFSHSQSNNDTPSRKRKSRETCQNCNIEFDPFDMVNQKCNYHPGRPQVAQISDVFDSRWSESCGMNETQVRSKWTCCEQPGNASGCVWARHQASADRRKRPG